MSVFERKYLQFPGVSRLPSDAIMKAPVIPCGAGACLLAEDELDCEVLTTNIGNIHDDATSHVLTRGQGDSELLEHLRTLAQLDVLNVTAAFNVVLCVSDVVSESGVRRVNGVTHDDDLSVRVVWGFPCLVITTIGMSELERKRLVFS